MDDTGKGFSVDYLRKKCRTKREVVDFVERLENASVEELAQAWRSRSLNTYSVDFLREKSTDTIVDYLLNAIDTLTTVQTRNRAIHPLQDEDDQSQVGEGKTMVSGKANESSEVENEADSIFPWIEALRPSKNGMEYKYDFSQTEDEDIVTYDNEGNILSMTPVKWIESLTSGTAKRSPAAIHTFLLTYRAFMEPIVLLRHLVHRFFYPVNTSSFVDEELHHKLRSNESDGRASVSEKECDGMIRGLRKLKLKEERKVQKIVRLNVISFLHIWITRFYKEDLSMDINLRQHFEDFFQYMNLIKPSGVMSWIRSLKAKLDALVVADASRLKNYSFQSRQSVASTSSDNIIRKVQNHSDMKNAEFANYLSGILARVEALPNKATFTVEELEKTVTAIMALHLVQLDTRQYMLRWYNRCFFGRDFVNALCSSKLNICTKREAATRLGNHLLRDGLIFPVCDDRSFQDDHLLYRFYNESDQSIHAPEGSFRSSIVRGSYFERSIGGVETKASATMACPDSILPVGGVSLDLFVSRNVCRLFHGPDGLNAFYHLSPKEIARQITLIDFANFKKIEHFEWLEKRFSDQNREILAPNICHMVKRFNALTGHVTYAVVSPSNAEHRARVLEHWLRIAGECHDINNFCSLYSIFCGLNSTPVFRLKQTWALVHPSLIEMFEVFSVLFAPQKNSMNFRNSLNSALLPAIPHVGMFLSDLTFIEDGNNTVIAGKNGSEKKINVMKLRKVAGIIERAEEFHRKEYCFHPVDGLLQYILKFIEHDRDSLYNLSYAREPRKNKGNARREK